MKTLKRTMAAEYSRELGIKVLAGQTRLAELGFKQGGVPGYGLRRMLVSADGRRKQRLEIGERKSIATDRVILVPGPSHEVEVVRDIYRMLVSERRTVYAIVCDLNRRGISYVGNSQWSYSAVRTVLMHPKYFGCNVFGQSSQRLCTPSEPRPKSEWVITQGAFEPVIDPVTFSQAQKILQGRTFNKSDLDLLNDLRSLLATEGKLTLGLIKNSPKTPSPSTYRHRFGGLRRAYELIGYGRNFELIDLRRKTQSLREELLMRIQTMFPDRVSIVQPGLKWRSQLKLTNGITVSVLIARKIRTSTNAERWRVDPVQRECRLITLLARLDGQNTCFKDLYIFPSIDRHSRFHLTPKDSWLRVGKRLAVLSHFYDAVNEVLNCRNVGSGD